ncbi:MAG: DsbE family thiol:disulfide interchange protein, partial [Alphaproteobacteria bacterium]
NYKDKPENALGFLAELGNPFARLGADATGRTAIDWGLYGVPETYVIAGDGTVMLRFAGPITTRVMEEKILPAIDKARAR